ncbi:MAG TPA: uL15 family ribosomal protein [Candidatus Paceibacterota bacterium]
MQAHQLIKTKKVKRRVGRGGKRGTFSGRGTKGQKARSGRRIRPQIRDVIKKIHKKRGYFFKSFREKPYAINIRDIDKKFNTGDKITLESLLKSKILRAPKGKKIKIKILGKGKTDKKFIFDKDLLVSKSVKKYVE